ncbi:WXG100 family type VII secretion target [Microbacterium sp. NPDC089987]|uniref:WXG100 family type VII secretion target n=1 Tax=Microbacterium sp. NPDC089987 TaxID=3364202 RepID=UPI0038037B4D
MSDQIKVGGSKIEVLVGELRSARDEIARLLGDLQASLDRLSGEWSGEAYRAYAHAQQRWNALMQEMQDELDRVQRRTQESNDAFTSAQQSTKRLWSEA